MQANSDIMCDIHKQKITTVCNRNSCNQIRSCCEECKIHHQGHQDDLISLQKLQNHEKIYIIEFQELQNKINTLLKQIQSGLQTILQIQPTHINNQAEIEVKVLYSQELKTFIVNFQNTLKPIIPALDETKKQLIDTAKSMKQTFESNYKTNQNPIYQNAFQQEIAKVTQVQESLSFQISRTDQAEQLEIKSLNNQIVQQEKQENQEKKEIDIKQDDKKQQSLINQQLSQINPHQPISQQFVSDIRFSKQDKSDKITLSEDQLIAEGNQFVLCENLQENQQITKFAFKVIQGEYIFIGACHKEIIKKNKYETTFKKEIIGHGAYLITSYGYIFSHIKKDCNGGKLKFNFCNTDIVMVEIDRSSNRIKWKIYDEKDLSKFDQNKRFSLQFDPKDDLCPCVYLLYNSKVRIFKVQD